MNLRQTFFWNVLMFLFAVSVLNSAYQLWQANNINSELWDTYETEQVGTDKVLQDKVIRLEADLDERKKSTFRLKEDPTNLANVIPLGDGYRYYRGSSALRVETYFQTSQGIPKVVLNHKSKNYVVMTGDSVAGGIILDINDKFISFLKEDEVKILNVPNYDILKEKKYN